MKQKSSTFKNGFSLIEVMVASGLLGVLSLAMMTMISDQGKANKSTQITVEANDLYNRVQRYMLDSAICGNTLNGVVLAPGASTNVPSIRKAGTVLIAQNAVVGGLTLTSMRLTRKTGALNLEYDLLLTLDKVNRAASFGSQTINRTVTLQAKINPLVTNQINGCFSQLESAVTTAVQESCDSLCPVVPATVPSSCWNVATKKCNMPAPPNAKSLYLKNDGSLTMNVPIVKSAGCSQCQDNCNPCDQQWIGQPGWVNASANNCSRGKSCGFHKWRNCTTTCSNGSATPVGKIFPP